MKSFKLYKIGLNDDVKTKVCPEANFELYQCIESTTNDNVEAFYQECLDYINDIFPKGSDDLKQLLGIVSDSPYLMFYIKIFSDDKYFPQYVSDPVDYWLNTCERALTNVEMYSENFLQTFEKSDFFKICQNTVEGKLQWKEWNDCSVSCGGGFQSKIAVACLPHYAVCNGLQILERNCNENVCPDYPSTYFPVRM